jgi:hypothetical protein
MTVTSADLEDIIVSAINVIRGQVEALSTTPTGQRLNQVDARNLAEYVRALTWIQKQADTKKSAEDSEVKAMTEPELESIVLEEAKRIQSKHVNGNTGSKRAHKT